MKKKIIGLIIIIVMIITQFIPFSFAIESSNNEKVIDENKDNIIDDEKVIDENKDSIIDDEKVIDEKKDNIIDDEKVVDENKDNIIDDEIIQDKKDDEKKIIKSKQIVEQSNNEEVEEEFSINVIVDNNIIYPYIKNEIYYLFLPKSANLSCLDIHYTGNIESSVNAEFDITTKTIMGEYNNNDEFILNLKNGQTIRIIIRQSDVPSIFLNLDDDISIENVNSQSKDNKYTGKVNVLGCDKDKDNILDKVVEFKGRGNTSWKMPKKSYQIKFDKKTNFLGIGNSKEKKWVLIANYQDPTLLKNKIMNDLCVQSGLALCPNSSFADLYVNGAYIGNYLVCDKIEIKENRVDLVDPNGLLVELDNAYYNDEEYWFRSNRGNYYTVKESVIENNEAIINAMNSFKNALNDFERELYSDNPSWEKISNMIDVESFARYYLINEFSENTDSYYSSCFLYKDGDNDVIHMGPVWDYDASFGNGLGISQGLEPNVDYTLKYAYDNNMRRLYIFPQFVELINELYTKEIKSIINEIDVYSMSEKISNSILNNAIVWYDLDNYSAQKELLNKFIEARKKYFNNKYSNNKIEYTTHIQFEGWKQSIDSGMSGTEGRSLRLEGFRATIGNGLGENCSISYRTHIQEIGWQDWKKDGELSGTTGQSLRLEAIQIKLNNSNYSVRYRTHIQDIGWTDWVYDGDVSGTEGRSLRLEAIEIEIVEKRFNLGNNSIKESALINYKGHIENVGDTGFGYDGEIIGTIGQSLRLEGIQFTLGNSLPSNIHLTIDEHIENIGWKYGLNENQYIGTQGRSLRLEALSLKLIGEGAEDYTIKYRTHVQNIGWQEWKKDGEIAGTTGQSLRIEAIQIMIEPK